MVQKSINKDSVTYNDGLWIRTDSGKYYLNVSKNISTLPTDFTFSFWVFKKDDDRGYMNYRSFDLLNVFGRFYFTANNTDPSNS